METRPALGPGARLPSGGRGRRLRRPAEEEAAATDRAARAQPRGPGNSAGDASRALKGETD